MTLAKQRWNRMSFFVAVAAFCSVMLDLCEDRPSCTVLASPETFTQDPCIGTPKYLDVHYKCRPDEFAHLTVCEGEKMEISCERGDRIAVYAAMFGRTPNGTEQCPDNRQGFVDCKASGTLSQVSTLCQGKRSCAVVANQSVFGEPCPSGISTYLSVSYTCVPRKILKQQHHRSNKKKKKKKKKRKKGSEVFETANVTTESGTMTRDSPVEPPSEHTLQSSSEVYETLEQQSVTQYLPVTESSTEGMDQQHSLNEFTNESLDITTIQDEAVVVTSDYVHIQTSTLPDDTITDHSKHSHTITESVSDNTGSGDNHYNDIDDVTKPAVTILSTSISDDNQDTSHSLDNGDNIDNNYQNVSDNDTEYSSVKNDIQSANQIYIADNFSDISDGRDGVDESEANPPIVDSTNSPIFLSSTVNLDLDKGQESWTELDSVQTASPNKAKNVPESHYVTERNLTVLCINYTRPDLRWVGFVRPKNEYTIGFLRDWFSIIHFLQTHQEKAWLYFTLGVCFGIIVMLIVILIKVCINFHRNIRARLDVSEPTHRSTHTNNHSSLDAPMLEHSDSVDRIEVVRFSPRNTLRSQRSNSHHRDLVNYYG